MNKEIEVLKALGLKSYLYCETWEINTSVSINLRVYMNRIDLEDYSVDWKLDLSDSWKNLFSPTNNRENEYFNYVMGYIDSIYEL